MTDNKRYDTVKEDEEMDENQFADEMPESLVRYFEAWKKRNDQEKLVLQDLDGEGGEYLPALALGCSREEEEGRRNQVELGKMEEELMQLPGFEMRNKEVQDDLEQDFCQKQEFIRSLQGQVEEVRRVFEEVQEQERRRAEALRCDAATTLQAATRGLLVRRWARGELRRRREEQRRHRELEEEMRRKREMEAEEERRKQEEERKIQEEIMKQEEEERKKKEEEEKRREEADKRRKEEERKTQEEEERKREEEKLRKREEERIEEEKKRRAEEEDKRKREEEEEKRKKKEEEEKRKREEEKEKREEEEEKRKREEEKEKREEEEEKRKREEQEKRKREEEEEKRKREEEEENIKREEEQEKRKREEEEKRKREEQEKRKSDEQQKRKREEEEENRKREEQEEKIKRKEVEEKRKTEEEMERIKVKVSEGRRREETESQKKEEARKEEGRQEETGQRTGSKAQEGTREGSDPGIYAEKRPYRKDPEPPAPPKTSQPASSPAPSHHTPAVSSTGATTVGGAVTHPDQSSESATRAPTCQAAGSLPACLPYPTEQKRLSWMRDCTPWSRLALQNSRKPRASSRDRRGPRRAADKAGTLPPPLCPDTLLQSGGWKTLQEVTTVTLEDLPGCSISTLAQCGRLQSLTLRRCGLKALDGLGLCPDLAYIDVQENDITFVNCENLAKLRVLRLGHNQLTCMQGLGEAVSLDVLDLSYNFITRIAGLESLKSLQSLSVDHNQLISTKGLAQTYTLLHLDCSHNHLTQLEGLENCVLLGTLDARANNITEPPGLSNHVLLRDLRLDHNSLSSLQSLSTCWLPLLQVLSASHNSITELPPMSDFVSLLNLDVGHNCLSEVKNACESLEGCTALREIHLPGNPLETESGWRATLQKAVPGLRAINSQETNTSPSPPADGGCALPAGSFVAFCYTQLRQTEDLQQQHSKRLRGASADLERLKLSCQYYPEALRLAQEQRYAHEYGDTALSDERKEAAAHTATGQTLHLAGGEETDTPTSGDAGGHGAPARLPVGDNGRDQTREQSERRPVASQNAQTDRGLTVSEASAPSSHPSTETGGDHVELSREESVHRERDLISSAAAVVIQRHWRRRRRGCSKVLAPPQADRGGGSQNGGGVSSGPHQTGPDYAATVIQALWRGRALRKRLASALASAASCRDAGGDEESLEEVDIDAFDFDEAAVDRDLMRLTSDDSSAKPHPCAHQLFGEKMFPEPPHHRLPSPVTWNPMQDWVTGVPVPEESPGQRISPVSTPRTKSPVSALLSGLSQRSEKILEEWGFSDSNTALLMLKRAQKMKARKQKHKDQAENPSGRIGVFTNCTNPFGPPEVPKRTAAHQRGYLKGAGGEAFRGLPQTEKAEQERVKKERTSQWLRSQAVHSDVHSLRSEHFLPNIDPDVLNGGRVQLVAGNGYKEDPDPDAECRANGSVAQPREERRNSWGHAKKEVPAPASVSSPPSKKERVSFRDNPVQMSGGWGGGKKKKRDKVCK